MTLTTNGLTNGGRTAHYQIQYDDVLSKDDGLDRANALIDVCEHDFQQMSSWFGNIALTVAQPITVNISPGDYASASWGPPITLVPGDGSALHVVRYLLVAEVTEMFMLAQNRGWFAPDLSNEGSAGEGLSRVLSAEFLEINNLGHNEAGFDTAALWLNSDRLDYVNHIDTGDHAPDTKSGCATLFINYLRNQFGCSLPAIIGAAATNLTGVYRNLTDLTDDPFPEFAALLAKNFPRTDDAGNVITSTIPGPNPDNPFPLDLVPFYGTGRLFPGQYGLGGLLVYHPGTFRWWLGNLVTMKWTLVGDTSGFGQLDDGRPIWTGDFTGTGSTQVLFYYPGDGNWWLGTVSGDALTWALVGNTIGFGNTSRYPTWTGSFSGSGRAEVLFYSPTDHHWWLGRFAGTSLLWTLVDDTSGFGQVGDGRPIWTGDFAGTGSTQVLFYYPGDGNWWLGTVSGDALTWALAGNTLGAPRPQQPIPPTCQRIADSLASTRAEIIDLQAQLQTASPGEKAQLVAQIRELQGGARALQAQLNQCVVDNSPPPPPPWPNLGQIADGRPVWIGDFSGTGGCDVLIYSPADDNWWLGRVGANATLVWTMAGNTIGFGHAINDGRPFWAGSFTGTGKTELMMYYPGDGNWWLGTVSGEALTWALVGNTIGFGNTSRDPTWIGPFAGSGQAEVLFFSPSDRHWWLGQFDGTRLQWTWIGTGMIIFPVRGGFIKARVSPADDGAEAARPAH